MLGCDIFLLPTHVYQIIPNLVALEEKEDFLVVRRRVEHLVQLGTLTFLDCTLHGVGHNEKARALELVVLLRIVPEGHHGEFLTVHVSAHGQSL